MRARSTSCGDFCSRQVATVAPEASVQWCAKLMHDHHVGSLIVTPQPSSQHAPVGILTDRDIAMRVVAFDLDPKVLTASDIMSAPIFCVTEEEDLLSALAKMREHGVRRMAVTNGGGQLAGVISADDVLELFVQEIDGLLNVIKAEQCREAVTVTATTLTGNQ
jgi:CBS domain-containing protein